MIKALTRWLARRHPTAAVAGIVASGTAEAITDHTLWCDPDLMAVAWHGEVE